MQDRLKAFFSKHGSKIFKIASIVILLGVLVWLAVQFMPFFVSLTDKAALDSYREQIRQKGVLGWFTLLGIQLLQIIVAVIPGEPIELLSGMLYGTWGGLAICLIGVVIGTTAIFFLVRWLGYSLIDLVYNKEKFRKLKFLQNTRRLELVTFLLFFIPGTPKDILTYFAGLTPIKPLRFILIATLARIPSIITSTYAGAKLGEGDIWRFVIIYGATLVLAVIGIIVNHFVMKHLNRKHGLAEQDLSTLSDPASEPPESSGTSGEASKKSGAAGPGEDSPR
jgi:uncharacterized membrane protein YdjX (TVP38/TMEM64 family)